MTLSVRMADYLLSKVESRNRKAPIAHYPHYCRIPHTLSLYNRTSGLRLKGSNPQDVASAKKGRSVGWNKRNVISWLNQLMLFSLRVVPIPCRWRRFFSSSIPVSFSLRLLLLLLLLSLFVRWHNLIHPHLPSCACAGTNIWMERHAFELTTPTGRQLMCGQFCIRLRQLNCVGHFFLLQRSAIWLM